MGVTKYGLEVLDELCPKGILDSKTVRAKGAIHQGPRKMLLDTKTTQGSGKKGLTKPVTSIREKVVATRGYSFVFIIVELRQYHATLEGMCLL